jgi:hypothetical protein
MYLPTISGSDDVVLDPLINEYGSDTTTWFKLWHGTGRTILHIRKVLGVRSCKGYRSGYGVTCFKMNLDIDSKTYTVQQIIHY